MNVSVIQKFHYLVIAVNKNGCVGTLLRYFALLYMAHQLNLSIIGKEYRMQEFTIKLPNGIVISSKLKEEDVLFVHEAKKNDMKNGFIWYYLPAIALHNEKIVFGFCFYNGLIHSLNISVLNSAFYGHGWNDWSEEKERTCAKETEDWLNSIGYITGKYVWGEIWAGYDSKGGAGHASVKYAL